LTEEEFPQIRAQVEGTVNLDADGALPASPLIIEPPGEDAPANNGIVATERDPPTWPQPRFGTLRALDERGNVRALADVEL
ncbi:MAG: sigma-54-dependent Fis family transcriptional regulator, partial [Mesorhizobium sp.]